MDLITDSLTPSLFEHLGPLICGPFFATKDVWLLKAPAMGWARKGFAEAA